VAVSDRSAFITGGSGFIGVNLARTLIESGWRVTSFDDYSAGSREDGESAGYHELIEGDIRDPDAIRAAVAGHTHVIHLAAHTSVVESIEDPGNDLDVNVTGLLNTLIAARESGVEGFIFASSNAPLGDVEPPSHEDKVPRPLSPYGASKLAGEALCSAFAGSYGLRTVALRFSNVYGPYSYHKGSVVATFLKRVASNLPLIVYGDGEQTRDFLFVDDLCAGIRQALESDDVTGLYHLGSGVETSVNRLVEHIRSMVDDSIEVLYEPRRAGEIDRNYSDITRARSELGFSPSVGLEEGLRLTWKWFEEAQ
jgi:UDP-glucose 4-epimerase